MNEPIDTEALAADLDEVRRIYSGLFATLDEASWDDPVRGGPEEWTLHETIAHLCALNGAGLEGIKHALRGEPYTFTGLDNRYEFDAFNRNGIDGLRHVPMKELCARVLGMLDEAACLARDLQPDHAELALRMSIYNRPVKIAEALTIILVHAGVFHSAHVAEPAGHPPLWMQLSPEIRHSLIARLMRILSLLYRTDIGGPLRATLAFRVDGSGGGDGFVKLTPAVQASGVGPVDHPDLSIRFRDPDVFCRWLTSRLSLPMALVRGEMKLHGNLRLFLRMSSLFSVDARPPAVSTARVASVSST